MTIGGDLDSVRAMAAPSGVFARLLGTTTIRNEAEAVLAAPIDFVWETFTDAARMPEWDPAVKRMTPLDGEPRPGARFEVEIAAGFGWSKRHVEEVVEWTPPRRRVIRGWQKSVFFEVTMELSPRGQQTHCRWSSRIELYGLMRAMGPLTYAVGKRNLDVAIRCMKAFIAKNGPRAASAASIG